MIREMLGSLCCPDCKAPLELKAEEENGQETLAGTLSCSKCAVSFPVENGIPHLLPRGLRKTGSK